MSYANSSGRVIWTRRLESGDSVVESADGVIARHNGWLGELIAPSPDGRYISVAGAWTGSHIWVYDIELKKWTDIGEIDIHPNSDWDYIKASWSPWFGDSSRLAFFTHNHKVLSVVVPDGTKRINIQVARNAGLAAPSPDGQFIAYVTFEPHPMKLRPDLNFWGGTQVWVVPVAEQAQPISVTQTSPDETCSLRWLDDRTLVFDRIAEVGFYKQARIWKAQVPR